MNDEALAAMYPSMVDTPPAADQAGDTANAPSGADALFPSMQAAAELPPEELSPELKALRAADPGRVMFGDVNTYSSAGIVEALAAHGIEGTAAEEEQRAWSGVLADLQVPPAEAATLVQLARLDPPDAATSDAWQGDALESLAREFGSGADAALADARLLVGRDPRLKAYLNRTGLGNHPEVVLRAARIAREQIASGKLKRR